MKPGRRALWNTERQRQCIDVHVFMHAEGNSNLQFLLQQLNLKVDAIMGTQAEIVEQLERANTSLTKVAGEIDGLQAASDALTTEVARLNEVIAGMGNEASPELTQAASAVEAAATALDEKIPDAPVIPLEGGDPQGRSGSGSTNRSR